MMLAVSLLGFAWAALGIALSLRDGTVHAVRMYYAVVAVFAWPLCMSLLLPLADSGAAPLAILLHVQGVPFLFGPVLLVYTRAILRLEKFAPGSLLLHLLPFFLVNVLDLCFPGLLTVSFQSDFAVSGVPPIAALLLGLANAASVIVYGIITHQIVARYRRDVRNFYASDRSSLTLSWLGKLVLVYLAVFSTAITVLAFIPFVSVLAPLWPELVLNCAMACFLFVFVLFANDQKYLDVYKEKPADQPMKIPKSGSSTEDLRADSVQQPVNGRKYAHSTLSPEMIEILFRELEEYMKSRMPFLDPDLDLDLVSAKMGYTRHEISQAINTKTDSNFYAYVNRYRVDAFLAALNSEDNPRPSITELAFECGFSSLSSFYTNVKIVTGSTPKLLALSLRKTR